MKIKKRLRERKKEKLENPEFTYTVNDDDELIEFTSIDEILKKETENFTAEKEILLATYSDDEF